MSRLIQNESYTGNGHSVELKKCYYNTTIFIDGHYFDTTKSMSNARKMAIKLTTQDGVYAGVWAKISGGLLGIN